jgi:translation initiation factor IF-2
MRVSPVEVIKELMKNGVMASINQMIDRDTAVIVATELGFEIAEPAPQEETIGLAPGPNGHRQPEEEDDRLLKPRPPVVTIMGHVDHGKTSLLDAIREANVTATEAGGITQHIGAYQVERKGQKITFLDTPGHEAFTAMRARGAQATDIAVLVVAADDGVMPQTLEAIDHARAAGVPIVVAANKIDKPNANLERVKKELADAGVTIEEWGGDTQFVPVSAKKKIGIDDLLESILVQAEVLELKANPDRPATGTVIEAKLDKSKGVLATVLVQNGTLKLGDTLAVGDTYGKIKAMFNEKGRRVKKAEPATPVEILGLNGVPQAGDPFRVVADEKEARSVAAERARNREMPVVLGQKAPSLDELFGQIQAGQVKDLNLVLKTDVQGSIEPIRNSLERLSEENVKVKVIHTGTGSITESDVLLAVASKAIVIGFNSRPEPGAKHLADVEGVDIRTYSVIYNLVDDIKAALKGLLEPKFVEVLEGHAEVRQVFKVNRREAIAGCYVTDGKITRNATMRIIRDKETIFEGKITSLKRFKDDVREVLAGFECGLGAEG